MGNKKKKNKKNPRYYVEKEKQRIALEIKEQELLRSINKIRMDYHPVNMISQIVQSDAVQKADVSGQVSKFVNHPEFSNRLSTAQFIFSDLLVYLGSLFASKKYSKHILKKKKKKKLKAQLLKELRQEREDW